MKQAQHIHIRVDRIVESPTNPRKHFDEEALEELAASIAEHGVLQPIVVRPRVGVEGAYELVVGHRRYRATKMSCLATIPSIVRELDDATVIELQLTENAQRQDVSPLEEADAIEALITEHGREPEDVAAKLGRSTDYVRRRRRLVGLVPALRGLLDDGRIGLASAEALGQLLPDMQEDLAEGSLAPDQTEHSGALKSWDGYGVRQAILDVARRLDSAPWRRNELLAGKPKCQDCPKRSGGQSALPGLEGEAASVERCLDPSCWKEKYSAKKERLAKKHLDAGDLPLPDEYRDRVWSVCRDASDTCYRDPAGRTWGEIAEAHDVPTYAHVKKSWSGGLDVNRYVHKKTLEKALKTAAPELYHAVTGRATPEEKAEKKAAREALTARIDAVRSWAGEQSATKAVLQALLRSWVIETSAWELKPIAKKLQADAGVEEPLEQDEYFEARIESGTVGDLLRLAVELVLCGDPNGWNIGSQLEHWEQVAGLAQPTDTDDQAAAAE